MGILFLFRLCTIFVSIEHALGSAHGREFGTGFTLLYMSMHLDEWLGSEDGTTKPRIRALTVLLFFCHLFAAVQDVALDAWALTMVQR